MGDLSMLTLAKWLLFLYPRAWRNRYATEFVAVLEQHRITLRTLFDIIIGAIKARLTWERPGLWPFRFAVGLAILTFLALSTYTVFQQKLRLDANHPQVELAQAAAERLENGNPIADVIPPSPVDVKTSLDPFIIVYNNEGKPVLSTGYLNGAIPPLPKGVLDFTRAHHEDKITWQPQPGVRIAAVVESYSGGFVLAGRSLRVVEQHEMALFNVVGIAYAVASLILIFAFWTWWQRTKQAELSRETK
jgi:hypothetical protein